MKKLILSITFLLLALSAHADTQVPDSFEGVKRRWLWVIEQISQQQPPGTALPCNLPPNVQHAHSRYSSKPKKEEPSSAVAPEPVTHVFNITSAWTAIKATVIDCGNHFIVDVLLDQQGSGWALKKQSNKEIVIKGGLNNQMSFTVQANFPYVRDYGLTIYSTDNGYPAFIQLY